MMRRSLTVPANQTAITITGVETNHPYDFTVMGLTFGEREGRRASTSAIIIHITGNQEKLPLVQLLSVFQSQLAEHLVRGRFEGDFKFVFFTFGNIFTQILSGSIVVVVFEVLK